MTGRQTSACSDKCRAAKSRQQRIVLKVETFRSLLTREQIRALAKAVGVIPTHVPD
jgi:hypothetical protein